jgi:geranylgeranyl diphosphate synthase type I
MGDVRSVVDARLAAFFEHKRAAAARIAPEAPELVIAVERLTMRGGKRLRPALAFAAHRAVDPTGDTRCLADVGAALELMQSYLLIHDDWMDADEERRGGPSVHALLRDAHDGDAHLGASLAILAGNLASAHAWELLSEGLREEAERDRGVQVFLRMHQEVVFGQQLDLLATEDVSLMQQLKTGSYTVRGPLALGAVLAGADEAQLRTLEAFGAPLGEAFQMRDDLLGTFGDPSQTGKPAGNDLRAGKRTALVRAAEQRGSAEELATLRSVLGRADASDGDLARAAQALDSSGARRAVEARLATLLEEARRALHGALHDALNNAKLSPLGVGMLSELADLLAIRDR